MQHVIRQQSAGGVVIRRGEVLLIHAHTRTGLIWTLPKGRINPGEKTWQAALREVREETGYYCRLRERLRTTHYEFYSKTTKVKKKVHWYLAEPIRKVGRHNAEEVSQTGWFSLDQAREMVTYPMDHELLELAQTLINQK